MIARVSIILRYLALIRAHSRSFALIHAAHASKRHLSVMA